MTTTEEDYGFTSSIDDHTMTTPAETSASSEKLCLVMQYQPFAVVQYRRGLTFFLLCSLCNLHGQTSAVESDTSTKDVLLTVASGVPLRVYLTQRLSKRLGAPVHARLMEPLFAFDRDVVPAGTEVEGRVVRLNPVSKTRRYYAIIGGDFAPLHAAQVEFTALVMADGRRIELRTADTGELQTVFNPRARAAIAHGGVLGTAKAEARDRINSAIDAVRSPGKIERIEEYAIRRLPWHPQWVRRGTRYDADLIGQLQFGKASIRTADLHLLGTQPPLDSIVHGRLITPLSSGTSKPGLPIEAVVSQPLFSPDHKLILPEGTLLTGSVTVAHPARWFHRGGQIRFNFRNIELPPVATGLLHHSVTATKTLATLNAAESGGPTSVKVDNEGAVKATEPKTRFLAPAIAVLMAAKSMDDDAGRRTSTPDSNTGGRTLGGVSGLGLVGVAVAQASRTAAAAMGFYGMAWSVYDNVISRGAEVQFKRNANVDIRFGERPAAPAKHFRSGVLTSNLQ